MFSNRLAFAGLTVACIAAAAGGGYLASRQNTVPTPAAATASVDPIASDRPVQETEAVVGDIGLKTEQAPTAAPEATPISTSSTSRSSTPAATKRVGREARNTSAANAAPARATAAAASRENPPPLDRTWPSSAASQPSPGADSGSAAGSRIEAIQEAPRAPEPPQKTFEELVVSADSVIGLQTETRISSDTARVEDRVEAKVTRDVKVGDMVAIPAGARAIGSVTQVERGGKFKERARLGVRFHTLVLADGTRLQMNTETVYRDGEAPGTSSASKIGGGAVGGAILGAILGGAKGAAIGATAGAGGGAAVVAAGDRSAATLPVGTPMTVRVLSPITVTVEQE
jgi:hypothetical protein